MTIIVAKPDRRKGLRAMPEVSDKTFSGYTVDSKLNTLRDYHVETLGLLNRQITACDERFKCVEDDQRKWKLKSGGMSVGSGFLGGFVAMLLKVKFW